MGKKNKNKSPRPGSVKANRAAGTNKAAQNKAAKSSPSPSPKPSRSPSRNPSPSPSPRPSPRPAPRQQAKAVAQMSVKDRRAGAKAAGVSLKDFKAGRTGANAVARKTAQVNRNNPQPSPNFNTGGGMKRFGGSRGNSFTNAQMAGTDRGGGLVKARRNAAANSGLSMKDYRAGVKSGSIDKHGRAKTGGGLTNQNSGSPWDNLRANFNQSEWDKTVRNSENEYFKTSPNSTMSRGWQGAQLGENGFTMDSNYVNMIPKLGKYGFKAGDFAFDPDGYGIHDANKDGRQGAGITGRISYVKKNGEVSMERDGPGSINPNWDKYAESGSQRMSSEGLYQDRYNVGYHGADDKGDTYASQAALGDIGDYFKDYNKGEKSFGQAYNFFAGSNRKDGYAGDVLKMIDQGHMKVSDDDYNMLVTDAKNYDWDNRNEIAGRDAGSSSYDSRTGGESQNNITANNNFYKNRDAGYHMAGSMDHQEAAAMYGNTSQNFGSQESDFAAPTQAASNFEMPNVQQSMGPQYQDWQQQMGNASQSPYASRSKSSNMNFNFNPFKFQQGQ